MSELKVLQEEALEWKEAKVDTPLNTGQFSFGDETNIFPDHLYKGQTSVFGAQQPIPVSDNAFVDMAHNLGIKGLTTPLRKSILPDAPGLAGHIMNEFIAVEGYGTYPSNGEPRDMLVREIDPVEGWYNETTVRAIFGGTYTPIDLYDVLMAIEAQGQSLVQANYFEQMADTMQMAASFRGIDIEIPWDLDEPYRLVRRRNTGPDSFDILLATNFQFTIPEDDSPYNPGIAISGSDIRRSSLRITDAVYRLICSNGLKSWYTRQERNELEWNPYIRHVGRVEDIANNVLHAITYILPGSIQYISNIAEARRQQLTNPEHLLSTMLDGLLPKEQRTSAYYAAGMAPGVQGDKSLLDVINRMTFVAHTASMDPGTADLLEHICGAGVRMVANARRVDDQPLNDEEVTSVFARLAGIQLEETD